MRIAAALLVAWAAAAHAGSSANFTSDPQSVNGGGGAAVSATFTSRHTIGQGNVMGTLGSGTFTNRAGFWNVAFAFANPPRLANISTRMQVLTGNDVMIGGFVIGGASNKTVAIVATGPSLVPFGIPNPLANPRITLVRSSDQSVVATNDDWQSAANQAQLNAAGFAGPTPRSSRAWGEARACR
jgi:hypothetical protein